MSVTSHESLGIEEVLGISFDEFHRVKSRKIDMYLLYDESSINDDSVMKLMTSSLRDFYEKSTVGPLSWFELCGSVLSFAESLEPLIGSGPIWGWNALPDFMVRGELVPSAIVKSLKRLMSEHQGQQDERFEYVKPFLLFIGKSESLEKLQLALSKMGPLAGTGRPPSHFFLPTDEAATTKIYNDGLTKSIELKFARWDDLNSLIREIEREILQFYVVDVTFPLTDGVD